MVGVGVISWVGVGSTVIVTLGSWVGVISWVGSWVGVGVNVGSWVGVGVGVSIITTWKPLYMIGIKYLVSYTLGNGVNVKVG